MIWLLFGVMLGASWASPGVVESKVALLIQEGVQRVEERHYKEAVDRFNTALALDRTSLEARYELAYAYYQWERPRLAIRHLRRAKRLEDSSPLVFQLTGNAWVKRGHTKRAVKEYLKGLKSFPASGELHLELGVVEANQGNWPVALYWWEHGIGLDPNYSTNYYWASRELGRQGRWIDAMLYAEMFCVLESHSDRTAAMGEYLVSLGREVFQFELGPSGLPNPKIRMRKGAMSRSYPQDGSSLGSDFMERLEVVLEVAATLRLEENPDWPNQETSLADYFRLRALTASLWSRQRDTEITPFPLFERWLELEKKGLLEPYSYWLLGHGRQREAREWAIDHPSLVTRFYTYMDQHPVVIEPKHMPADGGAKRLNNADH